MKNYTKNVSKLAVILFSVFCFTLSAQTTFRFSYDLGAFDITGGMIQTPAREFVVAGLNNSFGPYYGDVLKIDTAGNVIWSKSYTAGFATNFSDIKNVSTGGYIITGSSTSGGGGAILLRIDAAGAVLWAYKYQLPDKAGKPSNESGNAVIETSDGGFLVGGGVDYFWDGVSANTVDTTSAMGFKVNSSGVLQWSKVWTITTANPDEHYVNAVAESSDGYFFVGQSSEGSGTLSSNGDYPSNALVIKTTTAGALTYIRRWGAGNTTSQAINSAIKLSTGNILLGGTDDVNSFLVSISGTGSTTPSVIYNRRLNGSAFGNTYLIQNVMENADGNYSLIGWQLGFLSTSFNTMIGKINSSTGAWMFGRTYAPIGLTAILPEGGLCTDQGYYVSMTDQQIGGFNFNIIRTNSSGQTNDPASGCSGTAITPTLGTVTVTFSTPTSSNYDLMTAATFTPSISNLPPTKIQHCLNAPSGLSVSSAASTNVSCNGTCNGTASVTATGGTPGYTYTWSPSGGNAATASGLCQGTYTVTIKDGAGATTTQTFTITQPASALASTPSQGTILCNGGTTTATVTPTGGTSGYTYTWSPSGGNAATASGLSAGGYTVTIKDANNCSTTNTFTITQPNPITVSFSVTPAACGGSNGSVTATASGGTGAMTYTWNTGATGATLSGVPAGNYTVNIKDANNCTGTGTVSITSSGGPTVTATQTQSVTCSGLSNGSASVSISGGTPTYTVNWSNGSSGITGTGLPAGTVTATVTDANNCLATATVTIDQPTPIAITFTNNSPSACVGNTGSVTASASGGTGVITYTWNTGASGATLGNVGAGSYTVTATDANTCTNTASVNISTAAGPTITPVATASVACNGAATGSASVSISGGTPGYTVAWSGGGSGTTNTGMAAGLYTVTVTDAGSCSVSDTVRISQPASSLSVTATGSPAGCTNPVGTATANASGGTGSITYTWSDSQTGATASGLASGTYTVVSADANGCKDSTTVTIGVTATPTLVALGTPSGCTVNVGTATALGIGGTGTITYTWSDGFVGATDTAMATGIYTVTATDANGCSTNTTVTIGTTPSPTITLLSSPTGCTNSVGTATAIAIGGVGTISYTWNGTPGAATASGLSAGVYTVVATDTNGCAATSTVSIGTTTPPTLIVTGNATGCNNSVGTATVTPNGGTGTITYTWSPSGGNASTASGLSNQVYTVTAQDANGCINTATISIGVTASPTLTVDSTNDIKCNGQTNGEGYVHATGGTPGYTYAWSNSGTGVSQTNLGVGSFSVEVTDANGCKDTANIAIAEPAVLSHTVSSVVDEHCNLQNGAATITESGGTANYSYQWNSGQTSATVTNFPTGSYTVIVTDANGCKDSASVTIGSVPGPTVTTAQTASVTCFAGATGSATVSATGGTAGYTYTWSNGTTGVKDSNLVAGTYTVVTTDGAGCMVTSTVTIAQPTQVTVTATSTTVSCNGGNNGTATATAGGGFSPYTYTWSNTQTGATATGLTAGNYTVSVTDGNGCPANTSIDVAENPPVDTLQITAEICVNDPTALLTAPSISSGSAHQWSLSNVAIAGATGYTYSGQTAYASNYSVAWSYGGCNYITSSVGIKYEADLGSLPTSNVFTPNGDDINDDYMPFSTIDVAGTASSVSQMMNDMITDYELTIYDRWGLLLFKTNTVTEKWNGKTTSGKDCTAGTYYWFAKYKAKCSKNTGTQNIKGFVELIK